VVGESSFPDILAVDDTPNNLSLLAELLKDRYRVRVATNGAKAIELAIAHPPDLILLDIMMPGLNGYEVLERIRADARLRHIPVIMISAVGEIESVIRCIELGAEDYLPKPFNPTLLKARVGASLERKQLHDAIQAQAEQLADWNRKLEQRVEEQVAELERLARLKRFFAPTLVEAILDRGGEELLKMHRREVVVTFLDLRGFSQFTERCEPEEVVRVLAAYHQEMGELIIAYEGTLERFAGDGMMVFFNDPIVLNNPAHNAVLMALAMQERFRALRVDWAKRGYELELGIGIAQGYATLGAIGFESRWDYACIGSVSNLAARLCGEAKGGQILTEQKTIASVEDLVQSEFLGELTFKGIPYPTRVFNVTACSRPPDLAPPMSAMKAPASPAPGANEKYRDC
jgi:class 3 adenylate cyclase